MEVGDIVRQAARRFGDAPAIECGTQVMSFRAFDQATNRLGNALINLGLLPGDRVGVLLPNGIEGLVVYYALAKAGLVRVALNYRDSKADHIYRVVDSGSRAIIAPQPHIFDVEFQIGPEQLERMMADGSEVPCDVARPPSAPYRLGYTGGTTGPPKAVILNTSNEYAEITNYLIDLLPNLNDSDVMLHAAPVTHASGSFFLPHFMRGAKNIVLDHFDVGTYLETLQRNAVTNTFLVPTMIAMVLEDPNIEDLDVSVLRRFCYGASPISPSTVERARDVFGNVLTQTYGQAEAPMTITLLRPEQHHRVGSAGEAYSMVAVRVVNENDIVVEPGVVGEVVARGQIVMQGYFERPEETASTLKNGWLHTGDIGYQDEEGFLYLLDRKHDVIISGGFNVYPREVEDVLQSHEAVLEAAVVGLPDQKWGEMVCAVVSTKKDLDRSAIADFLSDRLAGYKKPKRIEIWQELPKSSAGKILRKDVKNRLLEGGGSV